MSDTEIVLNGLTSGQIHEQLADLGVTPRTARLIQMAALRQYGLPASLSGVSKPVLAAVRERTVVRRLERIEKVTSPKDGFTKYLFRGAQPGLFEAVRIPLLHRPDDPKYVICVSSQVGCELGCVFCASGRLGFQRQLEAWEMVDQVVHIADDSLHPIGGVVFMGMGEPMLNYDAVMQAARIMSEPSGLAISGKAITISTAGIVAGIRRFTAEHLPFRLMVSLSSADPKQRRSLMPVERTNPTAEIVEALRAYRAATRRRVTLAWIMMAGVNTREEDAKQLANLTRGLPIKLDLIDVNDPSGRFRPPDKAELDAFRDALRAHVGVPVARRYSGGQDINAACGMLAGQIKS